MSRAHDFYEDMRAQNRQVPVQQARQQKQGALAMPRTRSQQNAHRLQQENTPQYARGYPERVYPAHSGQMVTPQYPKLANYRGPPQS